MAILMRALTALPIILLAPLILRAITFGNPPLTIALENIRAAPAFALGDQLYSPRNTFFGIPVIDEIFATTTAAFSLVHIFPEEHGAYWQSLVFLTEFAGVYAILLLEACRGVNKGRFFGYPLILTFVGQIVPIGLLAPLWLFFYFVSTPRAKFQVPGSMSISPAHAAAALPTVVLAYYIPHFAANLHENLNARHWWMWVWQVYGVLGSIIFFVTSQLLSPIVSGWSSRKIVQVTSVALSLVNAGVHWYTDLNVDFARYELFVPKYLFEKPADAVVAMMTILQYDHICTFVGVIAWLLISLGESSSGDKGRMIGVLVFMGLLSVLGVISVGTLVLVAFELRERMMVADLEAVILKGVGEKEE